MAPFDNNGYTSVFGGQNRAPAQIDYVAYTLSASIHLEWPFLAEDGAYIAPAKLDLTPTAAGLSVYMPDASIASVGQDCLIRNMGSYGVSIVDHDGNPICYVDTGLQWLVWITDDTSVAGSWASFRDSLSPTTTIATSALFAVRTASANPLLSLPRTPQPLADTTFVSGPTLALMPSRIVVIGCVGTCGE